MAHMHTEKLTKNIASLNKDIQGFTHQLTVFVVNWLLTSFQTQKHLV